MKCFVILAVLFVAAEGHSLDDGRHHEKISHSLVQAEAEAPAGAEAVARAGGRITNGSAASRGQFPFQAALYLDGSKFCGGSLISRRWVLTAAQCAYSTSVFTIYFGASALNVNENGRIVVTTSSKVVSSSYSPSVLSGDIALIDLEQDITLSTYIQPITIATGSNSYVNHIARLSGWGTTSNGVMKYADLTVITNSGCAATYGTSMVRSTTLCAVYPEGFDSCNGGVGTPLQDLQSKEQIGILSFWHQSKCADGVPLAFTRVTSFASWISSNTDIAI